MPEKKYKVTVTSKEKIEDYPIEGKYKDVFIVTCDVEDIARPIILTIPVEEYSRERLAELVKEEIKKIEVPEEKLPTFEV